MKDTEFIELLNLYLDHELSAADAARLEAEVQTNAARRRVYEQYCRMQNACKVLAADFAAEAPAASTEKILAFDSATARRRPAGLWAVGSLAAAAAFVAFVLVGRVQPAGSEQTIAATTSAAPAAMAATESNATRAGGIVQRAALNGDSIFLTRSAPATAESLAPQLAWMQAVQLTPMQQMVSAEELRFDATLLKVAPEPRPLMTGRKPGEMSAFEFRP